MYSTVVVGVDAEEGGRDAITLARELIGIGGSLTLGYVHGGYPLHGRGASPAYEAAERERAVALLTAARDQAGVDAALRPIGAPSVGQGLHLLAAELKADLLVVGSTRRGPVGRVLLGDHTTAAVDGASCSVAVAPAGYAAHRKVIQAVGVAYDDSPESRYALDVGRAVAQEHGAELSAMTAVEIPVYAMSAAIAVGETIESMLAGARERLEQLDDVQPYAVYGMPVEELGAYSASVDLLVIGSRGYGPLGRLVHGSTTRGMLRAARCPLLVVPRAVSHAEHDADGSLAATAATGTE